MGFGLLAICEDCGFKKEVSLGSPKSNYRNYCGIPAIDKRTDEIVEVNYNRRLLFFILNRYKYYNRSKMYNGNIKNNSIDWGNIHLRRTNNYCPKCNGFTLKFEVMYLFD